MDGQWRADIVVGIDFGMTCTGVAWSSGPEWPEPKTIQRWPGKLGHELRNKVDTAVSYDIESGHLQTWGFLCQDDDDRIEVNDLFKLYLDKSYQGYHENAPSLEEARQWYHDYLRLLYHHIIQHFSNTMPNFAQKRIDFVFSAPVSWMKNPAVHSKMEYLIRQAGYGQRENERASIYLSEAEAAAIYASKQNMGRGEVVLVVDAGGSTTDLSVLKVEATTGGVVELSPITWNEGEWLGSCMIDFKFERLITERLETIRNYLPRDVHVPDVASRMIKDKFLTFKCSFGSSIDVPKLYMPVPGLPAGFDFPQACVFDSKMVITKEEIQAVFDEKINKMCELIDKQLRRVSESSRESVSYIVLSGGLGSSPYVQSRIKARYEPGTARIMPGTEDLRVLIAIEPQLAVVHGLVMARSQANRGGPSIYSRRCSPVSYGILSRELYDPIRHQGEETVKDEYDKMRWAERQIKWMVKQGDIVEAEQAIRQQYRLKLPMGKEDHPWMTRIVMSALPRNQLPRSMKGPGAREVCVVEAKLHARDMKRKNHHWWNLSKEYNLADFEVRTHCGTGLKFEIWKDGVRSREHDQIAVQWENAEGRVQPTSPSQAESPIFPF